MLGAQRYQQLLDLLRRRDVGDDLADLVPGRFNGLRGNGGKALFCVFSLGNRVEFLTEKLPKPFLIDGE